MKIVCTLPNASECINGVKFVTHKLGMISEEIDEDTANLFLKIKGYAPRVPTKAELTEQAAAAAAASAAAAAALAAANAPVDPPAPAPIPAAPPAAAAAPVPAAAAAAAVAPAK